MPTKEEVLALGKLESLLHIVDIVRGIDNRMEAQALSIFLFVARHEYMDNRGLLMEFIAKQLGLSQSSVSRNVLKLSDNILNPARDVLEKAAMRRRPPRKSELKAKFGLGLLQTEDDPYERRRKIVRLTPKGKRLAGTLMQMVVASRPIADDERARIVRELKKQKYENVRMFEMQERQAAMNMQMLKEMEQKLNKELDGLKEQLKIREERNANFIPYSKILQAQEKEIKKSAGAKKKK